jgi:hypothetical protein
VDLGAQFVRRRGDDCEAANPFARRRAPGLPQACERHDLPVGKRDCVGLLPRRGHFPFVEIVDRDETPPLAERLAEGSLGFDALGLGVDVGEADLDVLGPERHQAPAHHIEAAPAVHHIVADDRQRIRGCYVPARGEIRRRPLGLNREADLDLADIGGKAGAATHGELRGCERSAKWLDRRTGVF